MKNNINDKTSPNQMKIYIKRLRDGKYNINEVDSVPKDLSMRDLLKITRHYKLNEQEEDDKNKSLNKKTVYDQTEEEEKFNNFFSDMNINIKFVELEIYDNLIFWGGTIDGIIQFIYKVTPDEKTSGVEFNYLEDFSPDNPDNEKIIKKVQSYYDSFYKYWRNNMLDNDVTTTSQEKSEKVIQMQPPEQQQLRMAAESKNNNKNILK